MRRAHVFGVVVCAALATACSALLDIPADEVNGGADAGVAPDALASESGTSAGPETCPASTETDECFRCTDEACCVEYEACHDDPRCGDYFETCLPTCEQSGKSYATCVVQCDGSNHAGHVRFAPYNGCGETHCAGPCAKGKAADPCTSCEIASCLDAYTACLADADCDTIRACVSACNGSSTCANTCRANESRGATTAADALFGCWATYCQDTCLPP